MPTPPDDSQYATELGGSLNESVESKHEDASDEESCKIQRRHSAMSADSCRTHSGPELQNHTLRNEGLGLFNGLFNGRKNKNRVHSVDSVSAEHSKLGSRAHSVDSVSAEHSKLESMMK